MTALKRTRIAPALSRQDRLALITTVVWSPDMGNRLTLIRMKLDLDQASFGALFNVAQGVISRVERGHTEVVPEMTVARLQAVLGDHATYVFYGSGPERYVPFVIRDRYWKKRLSKKGKATGSSGSAS